MTSRDLHPFFRRLRFKGRLCGDSQVGPLLLEGCEHYSTQIFGCVDLLRRMLPNPVDESSGEQVTFELEADIDRVVYQLYGLSERNRQHQKT